MTWPPFDAFETDNVLHRLYQANDGHSNWLAHLFDHLTRCERRRDDPYTAMTQLAWENLKRFITLTTPQTYPRQQPAFRSSPMTVTDNKTAEDILTEEAVTIIRAIANLYAEGADPYYREKLYKIANLGTHAERNVLVMELVKEAQAKANRSPKAKVLITEVAKWRLLGTPPAP